MVYERTARRGPTRRGPTRLAVALGTAGAGAGTAVSWLSLYLVSTARVACQGGISASDNSITLVFSVQPILWAVDFFAFTLLFAGVFPLFLRPGGGSGSTAGVLACVVLGLALTAASIWLTMLIWAPENPVPACPGGLPPWWPSWIPR